LIGWLKKYFKSFQYKTFARFLNLYYHYCDIEKYISFIKFVYIIFKILQKVGFNNIFN